MKGLIIVEKTMIQDPQGRGWEIVDHKEKSIIMRRTQTFNGKLQLGFLDGLIPKSEVSEVHVDYIKEVSSGAFMMRT